MSQTKNNGFQLVSAVFRNGANIPTPYTCKGQNVNPPFNIIHVPLEAKSLALIMHDPDAVNGDFTHWLVWDIPPGTESIAPNSVPVGAIQGLNDAGESKYIGPCPPGGTGIHTYNFELYALDQNLTKLDRRTTRDQLQKAMSGHILSRSILTGLFGAP